MAHIESLNEKVSLTLKPVGYQFQKLNGDAYDDNWLRILIDYKSPKGNRKTVESALLVIEGKELVETLQSWVDGKVSPDVIEFIEPNLNFRLIRNCEDSLHLAVIVSQEYLPIVKLSVDPSDELIIEIHQTKSEFMKFVQALKQELSEFPDRGGAWKK